MSINPNDMAFPTDPVHTPNTTIQCGLTKREYAAIQIAAANCADGEAIVDFKMFARHAINIVDALFAELAK